MTREPVVAARRASQPHFRALGRIGFALVIPLCLATVSYAQATYEVVKGFDASRFDKGESPHAGVIQALDGSFYGTTVAGGPSGLGTVFKLDADGTLTTLHSFTGADGANPYAGVIQATDGSFYGTTRKGGSANRGTVFKLDADGTLTTLYTFTDGNGIEAGVIQATDGSFYGTTQAGGAFARGTVFKLDALGTLTTLHTFNGSDGTSPSGVIQASDGMFYGTTQWGGSNDKGTMFRIDASGTFAKLHNFGGKKGQYPVAGVIQGSDGRFYGTTRNGGEFGRGTVFKFEPGTLATLHSFTSDENAFPETGVIQGVDGSFYGTTSRSASNMGTVFKLDVVGTLTTLHTFNGTVGGFLYTIAVIQASDGNFYGTTGFGGPSNVGTIFKLDAAGALTTLYSFIAVGSAGRNPYAGVIQGTDGRFYGTTAFGGAFNGGTVFKLDASGTLTTLHSFTGGTSEGTIPYAGVIQAGDGSFYGTTSRGGALNSGTVFKLDAAGTLTTLHSFSSGNGDLSAELIQATDGSLYGTTPQGGAFGFGTVFKLDAAGSFTTLYTFTGGGDGKNPGGVIQATDGYFYGATSNGGAFGVGTIFKLDTAGTLTTLHSFSGSDGWYPFPRLIQATDGAFYGTTASVGGSDLGTVFKLDAAGTLTTLCRFSGSDGRDPFPGVIQATDGSFYGTTLSGGEFGVGTVFKLDGDGALTTLHTFAGGSDGKWPYGGMVQAADGKLYGTTYIDGPTGGGTVFRLTVAPAVTVPDAPLRLKATPGDSRITLTWLASSGAETYRVKRSTVKSGPFSTIAEVADTTFIDVTVTNGIKYFYVVTAVNAAGESVASKKVSVIPAPIPAAPTGVVAVTGANPGEINLSWNPSAWATAYKVMRSTTPGGPYSGAKKVTTLSYTQGALTSGKTYYFVVVALNASGQSGPSAEVSAVAR